MGDEGLERHGVLEDGEDVEEGYSLVCQTLLLQHNGSVKRRGDTFLGKSTWTPRRDLR